MKDVKNEQGLEAQNKVGTEKIEVAVESGSLCEALLQKTGMVYPVKGGWGTGIEDAIVIMGGGEDMEYVIMSRLFPGCDIEKKELLVLGDRYFDVITFTDKAKEQYQVCFDITGFYEVPRPVGTGSK